MKTLHQLFAAIVLTLMIAISSSAGNMHTTVPTPPPASEPAMMEGEMTTGIVGTIHTGDSEAAAEDILAEGALSLLQGVLSLL